MPLINLAALPPTGRLLGLDPGQRRIGVALSDVERRLASPYGVILRGKLKHNAAEISAIAVQEGVTALVIGLALEDDGRLGPAAQAARDWAHALSSATGLLAIMQDETLTTADTHEFLLGLNVTRAQRARVVDKLAAAKLLQAVLDAANAAPRP